MTPEELTSDWLSGVLGGPVESVTASPIGDGHVSTTLRLSLTSDDPTIPASVVAKVPAEDDRSRLLAASVRSYEREVEPSFFVAEDRAGFVAKLVDAMLGPEGADE